MTMEAANEMLRQTGAFLSKERSNQIKGIAILLMLVHHLLAFPDRIPYGANICTNIYISDIELTVAIGKFGKICVSIFMFLGGYGLFFKGISKNMVLRHIIKLYQSLWKVLFVFVPIGYMFFSNQVKY